MVAAMRGSPRIVRRVASVGLIALASCAPGSERGAGTLADTTGSPPVAAAPSPPAAGPPPAPSAPLFPDSLELQALGNEPFWSVTITREAMVYRDPGRQEGVTFPAPQMLRVEGRWHFRSARPDATPSYIEVAVEETPCSDGMSDERYRFSAHTHLDELHLDGCARLRPRGGPARAAR
jgi:uncharacterized membrane protein